jgi:SHS2 domain-containing protein
MPYKFLEGITVADVAFEATGKTIKELFESAALALTNTQIKDLNRIENRVKKEIKTEAEDIEMLLYNFLQNLVFLKDAEQLLFNKFEIEIIPKNKKWLLVAICYGEKIDASKHNLIVDVKAVSLHEFEVKEEKDGWRAKVVLDV